MVLTAEPDAPPPVARVENRSKGTVLAEEAGHARGYWRRLIGLMGRARLADGEGLIFTPCRGIHTYFMRFPIDLVFIDRVEGEGRAGWSGCASRCAPGAPIARAATS